MLREDYVKDKSIFELKKYTGVCSTYIVRSQYKKGTMDFPSPAGVPWLLDSNWGPMYLYLR